MGQIQPRAVETTNRLGTVDSCSSTGSLLRDVLERVRPGGLIQLGQLLLPRLRVARKGDQVEEHPVGKPYKGTAQWRLGRLETGELVKNGDVELVALLAGPF